MIDIDKETIKDFIYENNKYILIGIIILLQIVTISKLNSIGNTYSNIEERMSNIQTILGIGNSPDTQSPILVKGKLNPIEVKKGLLPIRPENTLEVAYIEKGFTEMDNYYPIGKNIIYSNNADIYNVGNTYKKQLINTGWQVLNIENSDNKKGEKTYIKSLRATNGQTNIKVEFASKLENYNKKAGSFIKIVLEN